MDIQTCIEFSADYCNNGCCVHNQQSDESNLLTFIHNQIQICSDASEETLTSWTDFFSHAHDAYDVSIPTSKSQFQMANHRD